jgi:riboflavin synthase
MFTGLIEAVGEVLALERTASGAQLVLALPAAFQPPIDLGESISVNGCCLTISAMRADALVFDLLAETLQRTNLGALAPGRVVNLERALRADARLGGHFVQGHIDCTSEIVDFSKHGTDHRLEVSVPEEFAHLVAFKGSIAIDGISLTIAELRPASIVTWIIPHTHSMTNLRTRRSGDRANLEFDLLAKYVARMVNGLRPA